VNKVVPCRRRRGMNAFGIPHTCRKISQPKDVTPRIDSGIMLQSPTFTATFLEQYLEGILSELGSAKSNLEYRRCCRVVKVSAFPADCRALEDLARCGAARPGTPNSVAITIQFPTLCQTFLNKQLRESSQHRKTRRRSPR
jgi:hypothetical protein